MDNRALVLQNDIHWRKYGSKRFEQKTCGFLTSKGHT